MLLYQYFSFFYSASSEGYFYISLLIGSVHAQK